MPTKTRKKKKSSQSSQSSKKGMVYAILGMGVVALLLGYYVLLASNVPKKGYLYIRPGDTYDKVIQQLADSDLISNSATFAVVAQQWGLREHVHAGKYELTKGLNNYSLVKKLRYGRQTPIKLVIVKLRTEDDVVRLFTDNFALTESEIRQQWHNEAFQRSFGLNDSTVMCGMLPDTYEFYWNTSAEKVLTKIFRNYVKFWSPARKEMAQRLGLTPHEAVILASIVEEETNKREDKPLIASVYLNRLQTGMKLQADPTVKFAVGDFTIKRIAGAMLSNPSPYNTYQHTGLPPGPICTPSVQSILAVLQAPKTNYIFFCATPALDGSSAFAATDQEHLKNARAYQKALNDRGIH